MVDSYTCEMPPSLKYPSKADPDQMEQLIEFTIGPDINLYEVDISSLNYRNTIPYL